MRLIIGMVLAGSLVTPAWLAAETLTWTDNSNNEANFEVERADGPCERTVPPLVWTRIASPAADVTTFVDTPATGKCYRVRAVNAGGMSAYTNQSESRPGPPTNLIVD